MSLEERFAKNVGIVAKFKPVGDADFNELYALYKQATVGDVNCDKPTDGDAKSVGKYEKWVSKKGMTKDAAKEAYIAKAEAVKPLYT